MYYYQLISILLLWKNRNVSNYKCTFDLKAGKSTSVTSKAKCQISVNSTGVLFIYL
jgi:hypothetical protein